MCPCFKHFQHFKLKKVAIDFLEKSVKKSCFTGGNSLKQCVEHVHFNAVIISEVFRTQKKRGGKWIMNSASSARTVDILLYFF